MVSLEDFDRRIRTNRTNSYKTALAKALLQCATGGDISFLQLGRVIATVYYRHAVRFRIRESNNPQLVPVAVQVVRWAAAEYYRARTPPPRPAAAVIDAAARELAQPSVLPAKNSFFRYVLGAWDGDFTTRPHGSNPYFEYSRPQAVLKLSPAFHNLIERHRPVLESLVTLRWVEFAEAYNDAPRLSQKVGGRKPTRHLKRFHDLVLRHKRLFKPETCWLCWGRLSKGAMTLDHVVPFDFIYSDDLWNLVPAHQSCNSSKGAKIGAESIRERVADRNEQLWDAADPELARWTRDESESRTEFVRAINDTAQRATLAGFQTWSAPEQ